MKKNKIISLAVLAGLLIVFIASYLFLNAYNKEQTENAPENYTEPDNQSIKVFSFTGADVNEIYISFDKDELALTKELNSWILSDNSGFPINETTVNLAISNLAYLSASRVLDLSERSAYGLDTPRLEVKLILADGTEHRVSIGAKIEYNSSAYLEYSGKIYIVSDSIVDKLSLTDRDVVLISDKFPSELDANSINEVVITNGKGEGCTVVDEEGLNKILQTVMKNLNFKNYASYGVNEEDYDKFGFNEGTNYKVTYSVNISNQTAEGVFEFLLGEDSEGKCYYKLPDSKMVFSVNKSEYDILSHYIYYTPKAE